MERLQIQLPGDLRLLVEGRPFPFKTLPKVEPLLAYLLLQQGLVVQGDGLAFKLWPDVGEKKARERLRRHL